MEFLTYSEFMSAKPPEIPEIIGNNVLVKQGKMLLYGIYHSGKSNMGIQMSSCISTGKNFLFLPCYMSRVWMINSEMSMWEWRKRFQKHCSNNGYPELPRVNFTTDTGLKLDTIAGLQEVSNVLAAHPEINVVMFDPLMKLITGNISDSQQVTKFIDNVDYLISKFNISVIIGAHSRKTQISKMGVPIDFGAEEILGSTILPAWADTVVALKPKIGGTDESGYYLDMQFQKVRYAENYIPPVTLYFNRNTLSFKVA